MFNMATPHLKLLYGNLHRSTNHRKCQLESTVLLQQTSCISPAFYGKPIGVFGASGTAITGKPIGVFGA